MLRALAFMLALAANLSLYIRDFLLIFLIGGCGLGACKWRAYFLAFVSCFYCKKVGKIALNL